MTFDQVQWLVTLSVTIALGVGGMLIATFRVLSGRIDVDLAETVEANQAEAGFLHGAII